jgi:hypothetical protein
VKDLGNIACALSVSDRVWDILFPDRTKNWHHLHVSAYRQSFFITHVSNGGGGLEIGPKKCVRDISSRGESPGYIETHSQMTMAWAPLLGCARKWLHFVLKDWLKANARIQVDYPLRYRYGVLTHAILRALLPNVYRLDRELGKHRTSKLVRLVDDGFFLKPENSVTPSMTAADYFQYCRIAYIAGKRKDEVIDESLSGREMYRRYADGRDEGLLDIDPTSAQEFADWIDGKHPKRGAGGHPWEIKRGGNTTHIDLAVSRPNVYRCEGFKIELRGESIGRLVETMRILLAIHDAKLPITIADPESVRKRLLAQDRIGIVPSYTSLHRGNQHFGRDQDVFDVIHYDDLGRFKRRATPFISWEPLPILKPR